MATKLVHNIETGEVLEVELDADELAQQAKDIAENKILKAEIKAEESAKAALLERLGITSDEAALLLK
jgi:TusA-related sulfurtransferase